MNTRALPGHQSPNEFRKAIRHLRSGVAPPAAARLITVGTDVVENELRKRENLWLGKKALPQMAFILGDWGFGKTHLQLLLADSFLTRGVPFLRDNVDGKSGSLAHLHRTVPRWMESLQLGSHTGLRAITEGELKDLNRIRNWCANRQSSFSKNLVWALNGLEWAWSLAAGHQYQSPDYAHNHLKALEILEDFASLLAHFTKGGVVLLLDEAENVSRQHDIRGRRKTYDALGRLSCQRHVLSLVFVTDRFFEQIKEDRDRGARERWNSWTPEARNFLEQLGSIPVSKPPRFNAVLAKALVDRIAEVYCQAFDCPVPNGLCERVLAAWNQTATKSVRLLVRLAIDALDRSALLILNRDSDY
jgi:hypothetical protein